MATIALYADKVNQMPGLIQDTKKAVLTSMAELTALKNKSLKIDQGICSMEDVVSSIQASSQTQEEKITSPESFQQKNEEFIEDTVRIDNEAADVIRQRSQAGQEADGGAEQVHPAEISGRTEKTIADHVLEYMLLGNQNHIFNAEWQRKIGASITDTGNALEFDEAAAFGKGINVLALRDYMITVGKNTRCILENLTLEQIRSMVLEEWVMRILEEGGVTTDFRTV